MRHPRPADERGATLVIIALALVAILGTAGLAIDGGQIFNGRRQSQNATDSAAIAGADALFAYQYTAATNTARDSTTINVAVLDKLAQNGAATDALCQLVDAQDGVLGPCLGASDAQLIAASGVQASATIHQSGALVPIVGINGYSAHAKATATVQPVVASSSPFIVCGAAMNGWNILNPDGSINITAAEATLINIAIEGPHVPNCGAHDQSWKGKSGPTGPVGIGQWQNTTDGNGYNAVAANAVAGQTPCPADLGTNPIPASGCGLLLPIADNARDGATMQLHIVAFAIFFVTPGQGGNPRYQGTFVAPASLALLGQGDFGVHCAAGVQVCTAKLSQ